MTSSKNRGYSFYVKNVKILGCMDIFCIRVSYIYEEKYFLPSIARIYWAKQIFDIFFCFFSVFFLVVWFFCVSLTYQNNRNYKILQHENNQNKRHKQFKELP